MAKVKVVIVLGPTAVGKSAVAHSLARQFDGEIINFDSLQLYRELKIGTAKPSTAELSEVTHHLYDWLSLKESGNAALFAEKAAPIIRAVSARKRVPILVGGSGFYLRALLRPLSTVPPIEPKVRKQVADWENEHGVAYLHDQLKGVDPTLAAKLHPADKGRLRRALEVAISSGKPLSAYHNDQSKAARANDWIVPLKLGFNLRRDLLYQRIAVRTAMMFANGLAEEATANPAAAERGLGYREALDYASGKTTLAEATQTLTQRTCNYAKRQITWFAKEPEVIWLDMAPAASEDSRCKIEQLMYDFLS